MPALRKRESTMAKKKLMTTFEEGQGFTKEDWDAVDSPELTDEELRSMRPARDALEPELYAALIKKRGPQKAPKKISISIRLSPDVIESYKSTGRGWQTRIDEVLRKSLKRHRAA
jgi:uncharacterized protein (DUF4415 family)